MKERVNGAKIHVRVHEHIRFDIGVCDGGAWAHVSASRRSRMSRTLEDWCNRQCMQVQFVTTKRPYYIIDGTKGAVLPKHDCERQLDHRCGGGGRGGGCGDYSKGGTIKQRLILKRKRKSDGAK